MLRLSEYSAGSWLLDFILSKVSSIYIDSTAARFSLFAEVGTATNTCDCTVSTAWRGLIEIVILLLVIVGSILLVQGTRRIPVQFAKKIVGNKQYGGVRQYIPLKVNAAGVMPIIFAQAIMFIPAAISGFSGGGAGIFQERYGFWYNLIFAVLIILFTYFYTAIMVNPNQLADDMKRRGWQNNQLFWLFAIPLLGALIYLCIRPPVKIEHQTI